MHFGEVDVGERAAVGMGEAQRGVETHDAARHRVQLGDRRRDSAGIAVCLARMEWPDLSTYDAPEVAWRMHKAWHAGLIVRSPDATRVQALLNDYKERFAAEFVAKGEVLETGRNV